MVTVAGTSAVRCAGTALRAAAVRIAVTGGLTLLACVFGSAVANAATSTDTPQSDAIANTIQSEVSDLLNGLLKNVGGQHGHLRLPSVATAAVQHQGNDQGADNEDTDIGNVDNAVQSAGVQSSAQDEGNYSSPAKDTGSSDDVWTGSTTVTVPTKTTSQPPAAPPPPPPPPVAPPPPPHAQPGPPPATKTIEQQVTKPAESSMGAPSGVIPDLPQNPNDLPLQQPESQPISSPSTGGTSSHDLGSANGVAAVVPPGAGFRPSPGSTTDEYNAKRASDGVPGLPSTSPD